jgi:hypothetical protein
VDGGERVVRDELPPGGFVPPGGGVRQPRLNVLSGRAPGIAGRQQIDVDGPVFAHRACPGMPMAEVRERRDVFPWSG